MLSILGGRKAAACITAIIIGVVFSVLKGDIPPGLASFLTFIVSAYLAGNVGSDIVAAVVTPKPPGSQPVADAISEDEGGAGKEASKAAAEEVVVAAAPIVAETAPVDNYQVQINQLAEGMKSIQDTVTAVVQLIQQQKAQEAANRVVMNQGYAPAAPQPQQQGGNFPRQF